MCRIQRQLRVCGFLIDVDGEYGPMTESAVISFQLNHAGWLAVDGVLEQATTSWLCRAAPICSML